jgi:nicotinamidase/pyrazinamidase
MIPRELVASFDVDAQNGFTPRCPFELPVPDGHLIVPELNRNAELASVRVGSKDCHPPKAVWTADAEHPQFSPIENGGPDVDLYWNAHCVVGTYGNQLIEGLPPVANYDFFVFKGIEPNFHPYGACFHRRNRKMPTGVMEYLHAQGISHVIVGGLAKDFCVKDTCLELATEFNVILNLAASKAISPLGAWYGKLIEAEVVPLENAAEIREYLLRYA